MVPVRRPSPRRVVAAVQAGVGLALLPFEPQYGLLVLGHHLLLRPVRTVTPRERLYATAAIAFHTVGVVFPEQLYRAFVWYDDVAHLLSGSLVAALLVAVLDRVVDDGRTVAAVAVLALVPIGLGWEMYEFHTPRLTVYGWNDSASDVGFNLLGGCATVVYGRLRDRLRDAGAPRPSSSAR
ncbi:MAG: hypothetical protein ABEJ61_00785 [Haloferacaceae archaeon]